MLMFITLLLICVLAWWAEIRAKFANKDKGNVKDYKIFDK